MKTFSPKRLWNYIIKHQSSEVWYCHCYYGYKGKQCSDSINLYHLANQVHEEKIAANRL